MTLTFQRYPISGSTVHWVPLLDGQPIASGIRFTRKRDAKAFGEVCAVKLPANIHECRALVKYHGGFILG